MYLKKLILYLLFISFSAVSFAQTVSVNPTYATDTACLGDTAFRQVIFTNTGNNPLVIDSIIAPSGFGRKGTYPITISVVSTAPFNIASVDFYHQGGTLGLYTDTFLVYSNAANVPRPFKIPAYMRVVPKPVANFNVNDSDQCKNSNSFVFTNSSTLSSGTMTYQWFFGDGNDATTTSPTKSYAVADTFDVLLITTSDLACEGVITKKVIVFPTATTKIWNTQLFSCFKNNVFTFTDSSTLASGTYTPKWFFGDGDSSIQSNITHSYAKDSSFYKVRLVTTTDKGCIARDSQNIDVYPTPVPGFNINAANQCLNGNSYSFTNTSTVKSGGLTHSWDFGENPGSSATSPVKIYTTPGSKTVRLIETSDLGCSDTIAKGIIVYKKPTATFAVNDSTQCLVNNYYSFTNSSSILPPDTMLYTWKFGDGNTTNGDTNTTHIYTAYGNYTARLIVTSNNGCKDSLSRSMSVYPHPQTSYTINDSAQCLNAQNFVFTNGSTIPAGNTISAYSWRFGNGDTSNVASPTKSNYSKSDTLTVLLIARSNQLCYDTARQKVIIFPAPTLSYSIPDTVKCFKGHQFVFDGNSTISSGTLTDKWTFGDGGISNQADTVYTYANYATLYDITYTTTSDQGCAKTATDSVYLLISPTADFTVIDTAQCYKGNSFTFLNNSSISSGTITDFWKFGNSDTTSQKNPVYTYNYADTFNTVLIVTSNKGCQDSVIHKNIVFPQPNTVFKVNNSSQCFVGHKFDFRDTSTIQYGTLTYNWDFGDATSSSSPTPTKYYTSDGTYTVTYTVTSDQGCDSTATTQIAVNPNPVVSYTINDSTQCINGNLFVFTNTTTINSGNMFFNWDFGNGSTSTAVNGGAIYIVPDTLTVKLITVSDQNCKDSLSKTVYVFPKPLVTFNVNDPLQCLKNNLFKFTNATTIQYGTLTYNWDLGDGTTSTQTSINHNYLTDNNYNVRLKAVSDQGCADSVARNMTVYPSPTAAFTVDDSTQCVKGNEFNFTDNSSISSGAITLTWNFGDLDAFVGTTPPPKVYQDPDTFQMTLIVISTLGACSDTAFGTMYVTPSPNPDFNGLIKQYCINSSAVTLTPVIPGGVFSGDNIVADQFNPIQIGWNRIQYKIDLNGCSDSLTDSTLVVPYPSFDLGIDTVFCKEDFYTLNVFTLGAKYIWSDSSTNSSYRITTPGTHWVIVYNACDSISDSIGVQYLDFPCDAFIPNAFTPEGNTVNDFFFATIDTTIVKGIEFIVFSRWGTKIFETTDLKTRGWDGMHNGKPAPEGVYGYLLNMTIQREDVRVLKTVKGNFHLLR